VPVGLQSFTGDECVILEWIPNQESDLAGYKIYYSYYYNGTYSVIATVSNEYDYYLDSDVDNGVTYFYKITAFDIYGLESGKSDYIFDTPRPEGYNVSLYSYSELPALSAFRFDIESIVNPDIHDYDFYFVYDSTSVYPYIIGNYGCDIQDFGYTDSLDEVNWSPTEGWTPSGVLEVIKGHSYIFWTVDYHFATIRVTNFGLSPSGYYMIFDWAYQTDEGNPELKK
jgi:hypothetical protein